MKEIFNKIDSLEKDALEKYENTYLPDDDNAPLVNNKKYFASGSTSSEGSIALDFYDQTLVPEEEKEIYEASVKNETYFSLSISSNIFLIYSSTVSSKFS